MTAPQHKNGHSPQLNDHNGASTISRPAPDRPSAKRSRMGGLWVAAVAFAFVLLLLLIFILQNGQRAKVSFLGATWQLPMGVALLLAAVFGILLVALPGTARIVQLRMLQRRPDRRPGTRPGTGPLSPTATPTRVPPPRRYNQDG